MDLRYRHGTIARAEDGGALTVVMANEGRMGDGLDLQMDGVDLKRFKANPVVGFGHNYFGRDSLPIGRAAKVRVDGSQLIGDVIFDQDDEFAVQVERKFRDGFLSAFSIGFDPHVIDEDTGEVTDWELFELSVVPIPMDPGALVSAGRSADAALRSDLLALADRLRGDGPSTGPTPSSITVNMTPNFKGEDVIEALRKFTERDNTGRSTEAVDGGVGGEANNQLTPQARDRVLKLAGVIQ